MTTAITTNAIAPSVIMEAVENLSLIILNTRPKIGNFLLGKKKKHYFVLTLIKLECEYSISFLTAFADLQGRY